MHFDESVPAQASALVPHADRRRLAAAAYLARVQGHFPRPCRLRSALLSRLVRRARPGSFPGPAPASGAVHPVDAGGSPVQAAGGVTAVLGGGRVLPDLRHRRRAGALTRGTCPPPGGSAESPTLGFTHLQFEALLTAARESANRNDFALVAMPGLLGLRILEATSADPVAGATANIHRSFPAQAASATTWMSRPGRAAARPQIVCRASTSRDAGAGVMSWCTRRAVSSGSIGAHIL